MRSLVPFRGSPFVPVVVTLTAVLSLAALAALGGFLDPVSLLITLGGPLAVVRATYPRERLVETWRHLRAAMGAEADPEPVIAASKRLARIQRLEGVPALERAAAGETEPFLRRALGLALDVEHEDEMEAVLHAEVRRHLAGVEASRQVVLTLGRLFPAFGLIGTLIGLAMLLRNLSGADLSGVGPGLAIAVLTTLYGAVLSNVVMLPLAARLQAHEGREALHLEMASEAARLVLRGEYPSQIDRVLRAYLGVTGAEARRDRPVVVADRAA